MKHSRTGIIYNVTPHAVGVIVHKVVGNRYLEKRVNIRVEHIKHSKCRQEFLDRVKRNHEAHVEAKAKGGACHIFYYWHCGFSVSSDESCKADFCLQSVFR